MRPTPDEIESAVWFAWSCAVLFIAGYSARAPWWRYVEGRALAGHGVGFLLLTTPLVVHYAAGVSTAHPWFGMYYIASFAAAGLIELWRLSVVWRR